MPVLPPDSRLWNIKVAANQRFQPTGLGRLVGWQCRPLRSGRAAGREGGRVLPPHVLCWGLQCPEGSEHIQGAGSTNRDPKTPEAFCVIASKLETTINYRFIPYSSKAFSSFISKKKGRRKGGQNRGKNRVLVLSYSPGS